MARARYTIRLHIEPPFSRGLPRRGIAALARRALREEGAAPGTGVSIVVTDDANVRELNRRYRGRDEPTDVLSFSMETSAFVTTAAGRRLLGEIVISYETAARQAAEAGHSVDEELAHLVVHGVLHLLGYDHERPGEARRMCAREEALLGRAAH